MSARHELLPNLLGIPHDEEGVDLARLKKALVAKGVNARGYRLYLDFGDALFEALGSYWVDGDRPFQSSHNAVAFLRLLAACEMDVPPPFALIASIEHWGIPDGRIESINVHFLRAAWKACALAAFESPKEPYAVDGLVGDEIVPVANWLFGDMGGEISEHRLKAGWVAITAEYANWIEVRARQFTWHPILRRVEFDGLCFDALTSAEALHVEGATMFHCIGGYAERCRNEMLRVYAVSARKTGLRLATLSVLEAKPGYWMIEQIKGIYNAPVPERVERAAMAVVRSLEDIYRSVPDIRREIDVARRCCHQAAASQYLEDIPY